MARYTNTPIRCAAQRYDYALQAFNEAVTEKENAAAISKLITAAYILKRASHNKPAYRQLYADCVALGEMHGVYQNWMAKVNQGVAWQWMERHYKQERDILGY